MMARADLFRLLALGAALMPSPAWAQFSSPPGGVAGTVGGTCDSTKLTYGWPDINGNTIKCVANGWTSPTSPNAFSFTNQTGVATATAIASNAVTLSGFTGALSATCGTGCTAIARNGTWGATTVAGFQSGDTIAIKQTSSSSLNTTTNATVMVGATTSGTWAVTTTSNTPSAFSFTNVTGANTALSVTSNAVALAGFTGSVTATCGIGCINIAHNGVWGGTTVSGFASGDTIAIMQTASSSASTATTATVTAGTTSTTWQVTTGADCCPGISTIGGLCPDGTTVYAGLTLDGTGAKMCVQPCDLGMTYSGGACTGSPPTYTWNNGGGSYVTTGVTSATTGKANTAALVAMTGNTDYPYQAAVACANSTYGGYHDWYLPAENEFANVIWPNVNTIGGFYNPGNGYWESTEASNWQAFSTGGSGYTAGSDKTRGWNVRCVRHN